MLFERFEVKGLAHYSYAVGCPRARELAIVDPERNIDVYLNFAHAQGMKITQVLETHIHADYASGARELAHATGARHMVSGHDRGELFEVSFPHVDMFEGDEAAVGSARLVAMHTPGHTPEHLAFLVYDGPPSATVPKLMLSGDFLFVGSLGRPDLLGEDAKLALAGQLFQSVLRLNNLPGELEVHPAHGAGSMCGAGMSGRPSSTLSLERTANPYLDPNLSEQQFIDRILGAVPPFPDYYRRMKKLNSVGPRMLGLPETVPGLDAIDVQQFAQRRDRGHAVIDLRGQIPFGSGHVPGSFGIGGGSMLATWAAWVVPYETPILLVAESPDEVEPAVRALIRVGLDEIAGYLDGGVDAWRRAGQPLEFTRQLSPEEVQQQARGGADPLVLDVRSRDEWNSGHIEGAVHIMGGELAKRLDALPDRERPIVVTCGGGYRSTVAASVLQRAGYRDVSNLTGGMSAWTRSGLPITAEAPIAVA